MKKFVCLLACLVICWVVPATAETVEPITLEPGIYEVYEDIEPGTYDVRFKGLDTIIRISYSLYLNEDGTLNLGDKFAYSFSFTANEWWQAVHPYIQIMSGGYLQIEYSSCELWLEE